ncbi:hypothetical protein [Vibrio alfacsensis]|uniref:hypothetical protein n=1 Tax=Vibrio alfacsensis TaxID=1074311 RepID=UPI001C7EF663|nr:hypothetical protein [Vibrio alfacsensis]
MIRKAIILTMLISSSSSANLHIWNKRDYKSYTDMSDVEFVLKNKYHKKADYYLRIDDKRFDNKITLEPEQEIALNVRVKTPPGETTKKKICTRMVTGTPHSYEVCSNITLIRY